MRLVRLLVYCFALLVLGGICLADETQVANEEPKAAVRGTVLASGDVRSPNTVVYLFDLEQSAPLRRLLSKTQQRLRAPGVRAREEHEVVAEFDDKVADLVPKLPRISMVRSD